MLRLESTISNDCAISILLGAAMSAEREVISAARTAVADLVDRGRQMFDDVTAETGGTYNVLLTLVGAVASGAALFVAGVPEIVLGAVSVGSSLLGTGVNETHTLKSASTYHETIESIQQAFDKCDAELRIAEQQIANHLISNLDSFRGKHRSLYDLTLSPIASTEEEMFVNTDVIRETANRYMSSLADCLKAAGEQTVPLDMAAAAEHHPDIGIGSVGPASQFEEVRATLQSLLNDLAEEVDLGASNLRAAADMIDGSDGSAQQALERSVTDIENYRNDPWTN